MDLSRLTEGQRRSVMRVDGPLLISAGAGSGKTFTLTQRIAYALCTPESGVHDIGEVLAITFTEKAAGEIKARVKSTLRQAGMSAQALKVDASWISTIHGMCSRILRSHALEIGIDPGFGVISDSVKNELVAEAINDALGQDNEIIARDRYARLFNEYPARSFGFGGGSVAAMLEDMLRVASGLRGGLDDIRFGPKPRAPKTLARELLVEFENIMPLLEQAGGSASATNARAGAEQALEMLQGFLELDEADATTEHFVGLLDKIVFLPRTFGNAEVKEAVGAFQEVHHHIIDEALLGLTHPVLDELRELAAEVVAGYERKKRALFVLDNDDLLVRTLRAFEEYPHIAEQYAEQFKLVMVDEFQDTSQIQIDIIERLAGEDFAHLCTVGDAQQSIYRFRGADVNVYEAHKSIMRSSRVGAEYVELDKNFRSHRDVLSFVDRVFEQEQVFGEKFMSLVPDTERRSSYRADSPRIDLMLTTRLGGSTDDARRVEAQGIAARFSTLRDVGHEPGDMVVLLGKMTNAEIYAQALREAGFECVIAGGSLFSRVPEVHVVARLAEVLANQTSSSALFEVLSSDLFSLSAGDFLDLSTYYDEESRSLRRCNLYKGFARLEGLSEFDGRTLPLRLQNAIRVTNKAWKAVGSKPLSAIVRQVLIDSGWLSRVEEQGAFGIAQAGNVYKAIRILEDIERSRAKGAAQTAAEFSAQLAGGLAEAPGALTGGSNSVVKIMTIHASKGLEFPLVALAEFAGPGSSAGKLLIENYEGATYGSLAPKASLDEYPALKKRFEKATAASTEDEPPVTISGASTAAGYRSALKDFASQEELAEAHRKFYVGLTRASEALIVALSVKASEKNPLGSCSGINEDVRSALCGQEEFPIEEALLEYGGTEPARFERITVQAPQEEAGALELLSERPTTTLTVPVFEEERDLPYQSYRPLREGVFSYSALASSKEGAEEGELGTVRPVATEAISPFLSPDGEKATDLGTVFHRLAQYAIETGSVPDDARIKLFAQQQGLSERHFMRLEEALQRWFKSSLYQRSSLSKIKRAEVPFFLEMGNAWMEGEIDLLCSEADQGAAFVVDYKTGGRADESDGILYEKHLLQASCYAYAVLKQGYDRVDLYFVRVEQQDHCNEQQPQVVEYSFSSGDLESLRCSIMEKYERSLR